MAEVPLVSMFDEIDGPFTALPIKLEPSDEDEDSDDNNNKETINNGETAEPALDEAGKLHSTLVPPLVDLVSPPASPKTTNEHDYAAPSLTISSTHPTEAKMQHINGFTCCHCSRKFCSFSQLKMHQDMTHHKKRQQGKVSERNQEAKGISRKVYFCQECQISIHRVNDHLRVHHLKKVVVSCGACSFGSKWSIGVVNKHIKKVHKGENVKVIDKRPEFEAELQVLKNQLIVLQSSMPEPLNYCLKCEKSVSVTQINNHIWRFHMDQTAMHCSECGYGTNLQESIRRHVNRQHKNAQIINNRPQLKEQLKQMKNEFIVSEKPNSVYCSDCQISIVEDRVYRHLAENHLKKVLVKCSLCDFGSYWGAGPVEKHIESEHKAQMKAQPVNERRKYKQELEEMNKKWIIEKY